MDGLFASHVLVLHLSVCVFGYANAIIEPCKQEQFVKVPQDGLVEVQPFKKTSARSIVLCTFDCTDDILCKSFVFLKAKATENCLLSSDPNGGKSSEVSETFRVLEKSSVYDEAVVCNHAKCQRGSTCVSACPYPYYACQCPPWAHGFYCENLNSEFNPDSVPWRRGVGGGAITFIDSSYHTWCTNIHGSVYFLQPSGYWKKIGGILKQVSVGESEVWGVNGWDMVFRRSGIDSVNPSGTSWVKVVGLLRQITAGDTGIVWGVNRFGQLWHRRSGGWKKFSGYFKWASCGKYGCWVIRNDGSSSFRLGVNASNPGGVEWKDSGGSFKQLDTSVRGEVYAVDNAGQVYTREGITGNLPEGKKWSKFGTKSFKHITAGDKVLFALDTGGYEYILP